MDIIHVGFGVRGRRWLELVRDSPGLRSVAGVDPDAATHTWVKARFLDLSTACYARLEDALEQKKADAAIVASPLPVRAAQAITALNAGLTVMIEQPLAGSLAEAARVLDASHRGGRHVMVAQNYRFARCERTLQELVRAGKAGRVTHVSCGDRRERPATERHFTDASYSQLMVAAAHHFDSLRSILGTNPSTTIARSTKAPWSPYHHGSTTEAVMEMESGVYVQYHGSLTSNRNEHSLWIEGDKGTLWTDRARVWWRKRGWRLFIPLPTRELHPRETARHPHEGMASLLDQFRAATLEQQPPATSGEDNVWTLSMIEAAIFSDKTGRVVHVNELLAAAGIARPASTSTLQGTG